MYSSFRRARASLLARRAFALALALLLVERTDLLTRLGDLGGVPGLTIIICSDIIMSNNIQRKLNQAMANYANGIAIRRTMSPTRRAEMNNALRFALGQILMLKQNLALMQAANVLRNIRGRTNNRRRAATKIQSAWRGFAERPNARARRSHRPQTPPRSVKRNNN
jgi:hypothetical protein